MTPADHWHDNGDGTAWWVLGPWTRDDAPPIEQLDRRCGTCGGVGWIVEGQTWGQPEGEQHQCPANCIDGRHTFEVEVDGRLWMEGNYIDGAVETHRVSIVPGMVLPIVDRRGCRDEANHVCIARDGETLRHVPLSEPVDGETEWPVTLPPAASPGMWAVKLRVSQ